MSNSEPVEPTQVWTPEEWQQQQPWGAMPNSDLRNFFKDEAFLHIYSGGPNKIRDLYERFGQGFPIGGRDGTR